MPEYLHPGVYIEEKSSGVKPIEAASTSTACFIGEAPRGPDFKPTFVSSWAQYERVFGGLKKGMHMPLSVRHFFENGGQRIYIVRLVAYVKDGDTVNAELSAATAAASTYTDLTGTSQNGAKISAVGAGTWANDLMLRVEFPTIKEATKVEPVEPAVKDTTRCNIYIGRDFNLEPDQWTIYEMHGQLGTSEDQDRFYAAIINRDSVFIKIEGDDDVFQPLQEGLYKLEGGSDGNEQSFTTTTLERATGLLDPIDDISILAVPGLRASDAGEAAVMAEAPDYAAGRKDMICVLDGPDPAYSADVIAVRDWANALSNHESYTACYYPWLVVADPYSTVAGSTRAAPPSGFIAGLFARTDNSRGVWKAPAGTEASLFGTLKPLTNITDAQQDMLNPIGVNCIRQFPGIGIVSWGTRTLATRKDPEYRYVPIRRFAMFLEKSLYRGTQWVVFEPNDEPLWAKIRFNLNAFMLQQFRAGALQGSKPDEAYLVKCDADNNIQATIDAGQVHVLVAFAPLKPAEFVVIAITQKRKE